MPAVHISEAEAIRDFAALLHHVQQGDEVWIEQDGECIAVLGSPDPAAPGMDPEYDAIVIAKIDEALDDPHPGYSAEEAQALFDQHRKDSARKALEMAS